MGEENKNVKKPAVSNAVVKKKRREPEQKALGAHVRVTEQRVPAVHIQIKRAAEQKIAQPEAMEAAQETPAHIQVTEQRVPTLAVYVQTMHQEERHSHKKEDAEE